jgi:transcriptional regulator with XRE-family HTH domain
VDGDQYSRLLGNRLRAIRTQKGMSLQDVQQASRGRWKAAVVGAYERGDRNVTVARLRELTNFYGVPMSEVMPEDGPASGIPESRRRVVLDLERIEAVPEPERDPLTRFTNSIQLQRRDFNGRILTIREDDILSLALLYDTTPEDVEERLEAWELIVAS